MIILMAALFQLFIQTLYIIVSCLGVGQAGCNEFINSLNFVNILRSCSIESKHHGVKLPELTGYSKTTNSVVNSAVENEYITFWQMLQKQSFDKDIEQLLIQSKGACLVGLRQSEYDPDNYLYNIESKILRPLFAGTLKAPFLKCFNSHGNALYCIRKVVKCSEEYEALDREMIMCAIWFLAVSVNIRQTSFHKFQACELESLLSDDRAISCIRNWDRNASIARILLLTFRLNARKIISYLTKNAGESQIVSTMQTNLWRIIQTEFPCNMIEEVRREKIAPSLITFIDAMEKHKRIVGEVRIWFVKSPRRTIDKEPNVYVDESILYFSVEEQIGEWSCDSVNSTVEALIKKITEGNWSMTSNPMSLGSECWYWRE